MLRSAPVTERHDVPRGAAGYGLDIWRRGIFDSTRPNLTVEVEELRVPEGSGRLLVVRVPKGEHPPYGTAQGLYKQRVGKNCMPMDGQSLGGGRQVRYLRR